jgi:hypothetical protein
MRKSIWLRKEISIADELLSLAPKLTQEFLAYHTDFIEGNFSKVVPYINETFDTNIIYDISSCTMHWFRHVHKTWPDAKIIGPLSKLYKQLNVKFEHIL